MVGLLLCLRSTIFGFIATTTNDVVAFDVEDGMMKAWGEDSELATHATIDWNTDREDES
jgi:hypothetical protein